MLVHLVRMDVQFAASTVLDMCITEASLTVSTIYPPIPKMGRLLPEVPFYYYTPMKSMIMNQTFLLQLLFSSL